MRRVCDVSCIVPPHEKKNLAPHLSGAGVTIGRGKGRGKKWSYFMLAEKEGALDSMDQMLKIRKCLN